MSKLSAHIMEQRGLLQASGADARSFLQGIVSNDVERVAPERAIWAAFLTPQGKYLHDFLIAEGPEGVLLLDCEGERRSDLLKRLKLYKLRSKVQLSDRTEDLISLVLWGEGAPAAAGLPADPGAARPFHGGSLFVDPRRAELGLRALIPRSALTAALAELDAEPVGLGVWERTRIAAGVPDGSRDMQVDKAILLENGFDELGGVDWTKGCYMGQELTARTKYRGLIKKRLLPVEIAGPPPEPGTPVTKNGKEVGELRSVADGLGLALLRLTALDNLAPDTLLAGEAKLTPKKPDWAAF
ncbi:CAF17-like 4Fe-4S cluster assembly/insertion protein YgfZ [Algihabitans albus]|uniref:CAF17-like 4Fe-4S cluster assembly/insertion protein YgfZ n=1 Tax=Algihabitans albus TaxID=2164067 RepID=UPI000E5D1A64|nr:folate-binding protein YgfZ [Algihabitans albus]